MLNNFLVYRSNFSEPFTNLIVFISELFQSIIQFINLRIALVNLFVFVINSLVTRRASAILGVELDILLKLTDVIFNLGFKLTQFLLLIFNLRFVFNFLHQDINMTLNQRNVRL